MTIYKTHSIDVALTADGKTAVLTFFSGEDIVSVHARRAAIERLREQIGEALSVDKPPVPPQ